MTTDWQPIESAPRDGTPLLVGVAGDDYYPRTAWWDDEAGAWLVNERPRVCMLVTPTHWMPLPEPPELEQCSTCGDHHGPEKVPYSCETGDGV
jgi:hypothetical protein